MRIGGLASGMDIDSIVRDLMNVERMPLNRMRQDKQIFEWQRDEYRNMNTLLLDFRSKLSEMRLTSNYRARTVLASDDSKVSATATSAANQGSYSISKVTQLASAETWVTSSSVNKTGSKVDPAKSLQSQSANFDSAIVWEQGSVGTQTLTANGSSTVQLNLKAGESILDKTSHMSVKVNGVSYQVVADEASLTPGSRQVAISQSGELSFSDTIATGTSIKVDYVTDQKVQEATIAEGATSFQLTKKNILSDGFSLTLNGTTHALGAVDPATKTASLGSVGTINMETGRITFNEPLSEESTLNVSYKQEYAHFSVGAQTSKSNGETLTEGFLIESSQTLNQVMSRVNSSTVGVTMFLDDATGNISMMRKETGDFNTTGNDIVTSGSFITDALKMNSATANVSSGQNAKFVINGLETERSSNTFTMSGITFTLKSQFDDGQPVTMNINNDGNQVFDNIKEFVNMYNTLISTVSGKLSEERFRSFQPLTDEQRSEMSEKQQEQWDEKAQSGMIRRDPILTSVLSSMRNDFYTPVSNNAVDPLMSQLASIGISTTSNFREGGKLEINEAKLKEAINNNPEAVEALFIGGSSATSKGEKGIIHRLYDTSTTAMNQLRDKAGNQFSTLQNYSLGRNIKNVDDRISSFEARLIQVEDRYWAQFTAMEKALSQMNSQANFLYSQLGMGQ